MLDLDVVLAEAVEQPPCGPNLEYDPAFLALEAAATEKAEQQFGDTLIPAQEPKWAEVRQGALALLARSKDLRVAVLLTRSLVMTEGFAGLLDGLETIRGLVERYWDGVHPQLDPDDDNDPTIRMSALAPLVDSAALIRDIRGARVLPVRQGGDLRVRDVEVALGRMPARKGEAASTQRQVEAMVAATAAEAPEVLECIRRCLAGAQALVEVLDDRVGAEQAPDFKPLLSILKMLDQLCRGHAPAEQPQTPPGGGDSDGDGGGGVVADSQVRPVEVAMTGEINTREDALRMLEKVIDYFERHEPTNPAPLLMRRARRLVSMNFVDIIRDIAPESLKQIESIAGSGGDKEGAGK